MTTPHDGTADGPVALVAPATQAASCAACRHPEAAHDATSRRWCAATASSGSARKCICPDS